MSEKKPRAALRSGLRLLFVTLTGVLIVFGCKKESAPTMPQVPLLNGWVKQASGTVNPLNSVHFIDANTGIAVGGYPLWGDAAILRTTNGGAPKTADQEINNPPNTRVEPSPVGGSSPARSHVRARCTCRSLSAGGPLRRSPFRT